MFKRLLLLALAISIFIIPNQAQESGLELVSIEALSFGINESVEFVENADFLVPENSEIDWDNADFTDRNWSIRFTNASLLTPDGNNLIISLDIRQREPRFDESYLCVMSIDQRTSKCTPIVDGYPDTPMYISDDGRYVAFTNDMIQRQQESDIYIFDIENQVILNRTDDGYDGANCCT